MDRTATAVQRQLRAMGCPEVEAGIRDGGSGLMILKVWTVAELMASIPWLKARNTAGCDIYVRPNGPTSLVLLDDLTLGKVKELAMAGLAPCCVTRTSPDNFQAWVRLADQPMEPSLSTAVAKVLAKRFAGDSRAASQRHFGRLAGFTNRKQNRRDELGRGPFVLLDAATGLSATAGAAVLQEAERNLASARRPTRHREEVAPVDGLPDPVVTFLDGVERVRQAFGCAFDPSTADWEVASRMAAEGFTRDQIDAALRLSPDLAHRKRGHVEAYIATTMNKLWPEGSGF